MSMALGHDQRRETGAMMMTRRRVLRGVGLVAVAAMAVVALGSPAGAGSRRLRIVDLGTLGGGVCCSSAAAINDNGDVVGASAGHAVLWRDRRIFDLGTLSGGFSSGATDINNDGDVVGYSDVAGVTHAALWRDGAVIDLGTLGGDYSYAMAINDAGEVVGYSETAPGSSVLRAFSWRDGIMTQLGTLTLAEDVSDRGWVAGTNVDGVPARLGRGVTTVLTDTLGNATAVNDRGQVAGYTFGPGTRSFLWSDGRMVDLGILSGATFVQAYGVNDRAEVVGYTDYHAFLWRHGVMTALPRLAGGSTSATDINNRGLIVGTSATTAEGYNPHAVLWLR
jgi:probable HAF family extracellular repeat protein